MTASFAMSRKERSYRNGAPINVRGFVRIIRINGLFRTIWARLPKNHYAYAAIDGELLTLHDAPAGPAKKRYSLTGAIVERNSSSRSKREFTIIAGRRQLLVICETVDDAEMWIEAVEYAASRSFEKFYILGSMVREHDYGNTYICYDALNAELMFNVDIISTEDEDDEKVITAITAERRACGLLDSDCIYNSVDTFRDATQAYFVRQHIGVGGNIRELIQRVPSSSLNEVEANAFAVALRTLCALKHMHSKCLAHRDIRPETILFKDRSIMVGGLGASATYPVESVDDNVFDSREAYAKPPYAAPEIRTSGRYGPGADIWALGSVIYEVVCGRPPPAMGEGRRFSEENWRGVQSQCRSFVRQLLCPVIRRRVTATAAMEHEWICRGLDLVPQLKCKKRSNSLIELTPTVQVIRRHGLAAAKRSNPERFRRVYSNVELKNYLSREFELRRMLLVRSRALVVIYRLMSSANIRSRRKR